MVNHIGSNMVSGHWHIPLREGALLDFAIVFPVSTETIEMKSLSDTAGTCETQMVECLENDVHICCRMGVTDAIA